VQAYWFNEEEDEDDDVNGSAVPKVVFPRWCGHCRAAFVRVDTQAIWNQEGVGAQDKIRYPGGGPSRRGLSWCDYRHGYIGSEKGEIQDD
jgi:hypothetical protein